VLGKVDIQLQDDVFGLFPDRSFRHVPDGAVDAGLRLFFNFVDSPVDLADKAPVMEVEGDDEKNNGNQNGTQSQNNEPCSEASGIESVKPSHTIYLPRLKSKKTDRFPGTGMFNRFLRN